MYTVSVRCDSSISFLAPDGLVVRHVDVRDTASVSRRVARMCEAFGEVVGGEEKWIVDCCAHPALVQKQFLKPPSNRGTRGTPAWPDGPGPGPKLLGILTRRKSIAFQA